MSTPLAIPHPAGGNPPNPTRRRPALDFALTTAAEVMCAFEVSNRKIPEGWFICREAMPREYPRQVEGMQHFPIPHPQRYPKTLFLWARTVA